MNRLFLIALLAALVPLGCGGSDDNENTATSSSTTQESTQRETGSGGTKTHTTKGDDKPKTTSDHTKTTGDRSSATGDRSSATGTGGGSAPTAGSTPTKEQFIAKADKVCAEFSKRLSSIPEPGGDANATVLLYRKVAKQRGELYRNFASLTKPPEDRQILAQYQSNLKQSAALADQTAAAVEGNDVQRVPALIESSRTLAQRNEKIAKAYGFHSCGG
jgi:hypothetical protein